MAFQETLLGGKKKTEIAVEQTVKISISPNLYGNIIGEKRDVFTPKLYVTFLGEKYIIWGKRMKE